MDKDQNEWHPDHGAAADQFDAMEAANSQTPNEPPSASEPLDDEPQSVDPPDLVVDAIERCGGIHIPVGVDEHSEPYDRMLKGRCVACGAPLGPDTVAFLTKHGIAMLFCSGVCTNDYQIMGWMSEVYDDLTQKMQFRGGNNG